MLYLPDCRTRAALTSGRTGVPPVREGELFETRRHLPHWQIGSLVYFVTFSTRRVPLPCEARQVVLDTCRYWHRTRLLLHLVCVMPDHVHALMEPLRLPAGDYYNLSTLLHSIKSYSVHAVNNLMNRTGPLWEEESWDHLIRDEAEYAETWTYIVNNPVKAGLVAKPEDYPFTWFEVLDRRDACPPTDESGSGR